MNFVVVLAPGGNYVRWAVEIGGCNFHNRCTLGVSALEKCVRVIGKERMLLVGK